MKRTKTRHFPTNKREPVGGLRPGDNRKMRELWQEKVKLENEFLREATNFVKEIREALK